MKPGCAVHSLSDLGGSAALVGTFCSPLSFSTSLIRFTECLPCAGYCAIFFTFIIPSSHWTAPCHAGIILNGIQSHAVLVLYGCEQCQF